MPCCNAYVERFHGLCNQFFWQRHHFTDVAAIPEPYTNWLNSFRQSYAPDSQDGQTPQQMRQHLPDQRVCTLSDDVQWHPGERLPIVTGQIHCLRRTDGQGHLNVLGRSFTLDAHYRHCYIRATLSVVDQQVAFFFQAAADAPLEQVATQPFLLPNDIVPWKPLLYQQFLVHTVND